MSAAAKEENDDDMLLCCASCGVAGDDDTKLKKCACELVRYCGVKCQRDHRPQHKKECKKRVAELRDEILFKQPESSRHGDCPICCLPLEIDLEKSTLMSCCSKLICTGCIYANQKREYEGKLQHSCPFCRHLAPKSHREREMMLTKRAQANDAKAVNQVGRWRYERGDLSGAFEFWTKAVELGDINAHYELAKLYHFGQGVQKDAKKQMHHLEQAAIGGDPVARHNLGSQAMRSGRYERAVKHYIIATKMGFDESRDDLTRCFGLGLISKDEFAIAIRAHQAAVEETKSPQRDAAAKYKWEEL